jgi:hypothetical protein
VAAAAGAARRALRPAAARERFWRRLNGIAKLIMASSYMAQGIGSTIGAPLAAMTYEPDVRRARRASATPAAAIRCSALPQSSNEILQKGLDFCCEQSVTVHADSPFGILPRRLSDHAAGCRRN